jgi:hypothetical protein
MLAAPSIAWMLSAGVETKAEAPVVGVIRNQ